MSKVRPIKLNGGPLDGLEMLVPPDTEFVQLGTAHRWEPSAVRSRDDGVDREVWSLVTIPGAPWPSEGGA